MFRQHISTGLIIRILVILGVFSPLLISSIRQPFPPANSVFATQVCSSLPASDQPDYSESFIENNDVSSFQVHSASIAEMANHELRAVWFEGSREGARDVAIFTSAWNGVDRKWSPPVVLVDRHQVENDIGNYIKTVGNPVLFTDGRGRTWLFFVTVTVGGWSGGDINSKFSDDNGQTWFAAKRLTTAPVPHSGTLVKGTAFDYADGTIGLPVYRSYGRYSFPELLRLNQNGEVIAITGMSNGTRGGLQPTVVMPDDRHATAFLRFNGDEPRRILRTTTEDAGQTWSSPVQTELPNPDSAVSAIRLTDGRLLIVFNNSTVDRHILSMAISSDLGVNWKVIHSFEGGENAAASDINDEFSYPQLTGTCGGEIHLVYTWQRKRIKHIVFNEAWVNKLNG